MEVHYLKIRKITLNNGAGTIGVKMKRIEGNIFDLELWPTSTLETAPENAIKSYVDEGCTKWILFSDLYTEEPE